MSVATVTITSDGKPMNDSYELMSLSVTKEVNRIPGAEIRLVDGDSASQEFVISDTSFFEIGRLVDIKLRYEGQRDHGVFSGIVVGQLVESSRLGSYLAVRLKDIAVRLTQTRTSAVFAEQTDAEIIGSLASSGGLIKGDIPATKPTHEEIVQFRCTDWDFIVSRADVNGMLVVVDGGRISLAPIDVNGRAVHTYEFGLSPIYDFEIELDGSSQFEGVESIAWDPASQKVTNAATAASPGFNRDGKKIAQTIGSGLATLSHSASMLRDERAAWADARLARNRLALVRGRLAIPGQGDLQLLDVIEVAGIGKRFNGVTIVTGLVHRLSAQGWVTDVQFGVSADGFAGEPGIAEVGAAGLLPPVGGLQIGVVAEFDDDPASEFRVRVVIPGIGPKPGPVWARLAAPDAGPGRGWFFRPEVGDEVVLGFLNDDPRQPIVLGSLFSSAQKPPDGLAVDKDNLSKGIVTRGGTKLTFTDDEKSSVTIETAAENSVVLDDDSQEIVVTDQHGNTITMSKDGIEISSAKKLALRADGDVTISADGKVEIKGSKVDVK